MKNLGYYNGKIGLLEEMMIPMNDRVCWFGDGVYDAGPSHNYTIFAMDEHIDRFFRSAEAVGIVIPMSKQELKDLLNDLVKKLDTPDNFVYYQVTRGTGIRNHEFPKVPGNLWVLMKPAKADGSGDPVKLITYPDKRFYYCNVKTLNLIPSVMSANAAIDQGAEEAIFYRDEDEVTECSHSNISVLKDGILYTHPEGDKILSGIARRHLLDACVKLGVPVKEEVFGIKFMMEADELIKTSSSKLCVRVGEVDGKAVGLKDDKTYNMLNDYLMNEYYEATGGK